MALERMIWWMALCLVGLVPVGSSPLSNGPWGPTNPVADKGSTVIVPGSNDGSSQVRVTVLTDRLLRIERSRSAAGGFEDRKTVAVINRNLPVPEFTTDQSKGVLKLQTKCLMLTYQIGTAFSAETLQVSGYLQCRLKTNSIADWTFSYGQDDPLNLLGTIRTLDRRNAVTLNCSQTDPGTDHCEWGLISRSGYAIVNDTLNFALGDDDDWWAGPNRDQEDWYLLGHGHDYAAALSDYRQIGGFIPLLPRYALGVWFSRWYDYTAASAAQVVKDFEWHNLPLDVMVLDMNWHRKNDWTGYSFDPRLYGSPEDAVAYMKHRGVAVTLNLHDANGVNPWEDKYADLCAALGWSQGEPVPFSIINETIVYAVEDMVLKPLEDVGVCFWWIDWQQGEQGKGGAAGGKQNPTIWTAHIRSTDTNRRRQMRLLRDQETTLRSLVLARWGGLGAHRYPVHFSGDVATLSWDDLAYQLYFSMTATNVGAIWSHDIVGPALDPELYTRWLQWGTVSGVMRSHDRGMASGMCAAQEPSICSVVVPWNVAPKYAQANAEALRRRGGLIPYLYTAAYKAHKTGQWFTIPMYYKWPELEGSYETATPRPDAGAKYDPQYLLGDDIWTAPVVKPANKTDGLARLHLWVPPGLWIGMTGGQVLEGNQDGSSFIDLVADLNEIPMFARAGSIIPTIPVRPGATVGLAMKPYDELIWNVYLAVGVPPSGSGFVYEDDGSTTAYYERDAFTMTTASYNISVSAVKDQTSRVLNGQQTDSGNGDLFLSTTKTITFTVSTSGHCEKLPTTRATTIRLVNAMPPTSVVVNGLPFPYSRFGGKGTWSYESMDAVVKVEVPVSQIADGWQVVLEIPGENDGSDDALLDGIGFRLQRAIAAKETLDELGRTPGSWTDKSSGHLLLAASAGSRLEYLAQPSLRASFIDLLRTFPTHLQGALEEVQQLQSNNPNARAAVLIRSALQL